MGKIIDWNVDGSATVTEWDDGTGAGTVLHLIVGQSGGFGPTGVAGGPSLGRAGGYPRGGAASEVRIGGTSLADTKIVAGGGGGAEAGYYGSAGGAGGSGMAAGSGPVPGTLTGPGSGASGGNGATGNGGGGGGYYGGGSRSGGSSWLDTTLFTAVSPVIPTGPFIEITLDYTGPWVPPSGWRLGLGLS